jgi:hypothetical protein
MADDVVRGQAQVGERRVQTGRLVDPGRQHHHGALVEDHLHLQPQDADRVHDLDFEGLRGRDDHRPARQRRHAPLAQPFDQRVGGSRTEEARLARGGPPVDAAVFRDDGVEDREVGADPLEILEDPPGHQHDAAAAGAQALQGIARGGRDDAPLGDRAVVVAGKRVVPHCA